MGCRVGVAVGPRVQLWASIACKGQGPVCMSYHRTRILLVDREAPACGKLVLAYTQVCTPPEF